MGSQVSMIKSKMILDIVVYFHSLFLEGSG